MAKLSTYMAAARDTELPEKLFQDAKFDLLDTVAVKSLQARNCAFSSRRL